MKALTTLDDILDFVSDNSSEFPDDRVNSIIDTVKEKKIEILLQSKIDKNKFDFSDINNYPIKVKDIINLVYSDTDNIKVNPFEIADFFGIKVKKILDDSDNIAYLHYDLDDDSNIEIGYKDYSKKGYSELGAFLVGHELGHLFNHSLLGVFFKNETYNSHNHDLLDNIKSIINGKDSANNIDYVRDYMKNKAFFSDEVNKYEIEADIFGWDILYYPNEVSIKNDMSNFSRKLRKDMYKLNDDK